MLQPQSLGSSAERRQSCNEMFYTVWMICLCPAFIDIYISDKAKQCSFLPPSCIKCFKSFLPLEKKKEEMALKFHLL